MILQRNFALIWIFLLLIPTIAAGSEVSVDGIVVDRARKPLAQAVVRLVHDAPRYWLPSELEPLAEGRTGSDGRFHLSGDVPDTVPLALVASAPGYRLARFPLDRAKLNLQVGLRLETGNTLRGRIMDETGRPISDAQIGPLLPSADTERLTAEKVLPQWTRSAPDGTFAFDGVMPGVDHHFLVQADGFEMADISAPAGSGELVLRLHPGGSEIAGLIVSRGAPSSGFAGMKVRLNGNGFDVVVAADGTGSFRIAGVPDGEYSLEPLPGADRAARVALVTLPDAAGSTWPLEISSGYSISGRVVDAETSTPAPGVALRINRSNEHDGIEVISGTDGTWLAGPLHVPGTPGIEVLPESGFVSVSDIGEEASDLPMTDGFTDLSGADVRVRRKRVIAAELAGFDQTTSPVVLSLLGPLASGRARAQRVTATTPTAELTVYSGGEYRLWGVSGGLTTNLAAFPVGTAPRISVPLHLGPAARLTGRLLVRSADGSTTRADGYAVRVLIPSETTSTALAETAPVGRETEDPALAVRILAEVPRPASDGFFSFPALPPGPVQVEVRNRSGSRTETKSALLTAGSAGNLDFLLEPGRTLAGALVTTDNRPVPSAAIRVRLRGGAAGAGREITLEADEQGRFRAEDLEADVAESLYVDFHGFLPTRLGPLPLPAEGVRIVLSKRGLLRARVEDSPSTRWEVFLMQAEPWRRGTHPEQFMSRPAEAGVRVAGGEEAELRVPGEGRFRVVALGSGGRVAVSPPFSWTPGDDTDRQIVLTPDSTGGLTGSFEGSGSADVTAWNTALPDHPGLTSEFKSQAAGGRFSFSGLPPGDYLVIAAGEDVYASLPNVQVSAGGVTNVTLENDTGGAPVRGVIRMGQNPLGGAELELVSQTDETAPVRSTRSNSQGAFTFETVPPDDYLVLSTAQTETGELKGQRSVTVARRGDPPPVDLDLQPGRNVTVSGIDAASLGLTPPGDVFFLNRQSRDLIKAAWSASGDLQAELPAGQYDVWRGDETIGSATVTPEGAARLAPPLPAP